MYNQRESQYRQNYPRQDQPDRQRERRFGSGTGVYEEEEYGQERDDYRGGESGESRRYGRGASSESYGPHRYQDDSNWGDRGYGSMMGRGGYESEGRGNFDQQGVQHGQPSWSQGSQWRQSERQPWDSGQQSWSQRGQGQQYGGPQGQPNWGQGREQGWTQGGGYGQSGYGRSGSQSMGYGRQYRGQEGSGAQQRYVGRGPKGYRRSDERILEDVNEALSQNPDLDAGEIEVKVQNGEVTLTGTVEDRQSKRLAEDIAEQCSGVHDVRNEIRVQRAGESQSESAGQGRSRSGTASGQPQKAER